MNALRSSRARTFGALGAIGIGLVVLGLILPFAFGDRVKGVAAPTAGAPDLEAGVSDTESSMVTATTAPTDAAVAPDDGPVTSPTGGGAPRAPAMGSTPPPESVRLGPSDVGVTASEVRIGVIIPDLGTVGRFGFTVAFDPEEAKRQWGAFIDEVNDGGGVFGRRLVAHYRIVDIANANDRQTACVELTEDHKVFAVISDLAIQNQDVLCVTERHSRPFLAGGDIDTESFARSKGLLFSHDASRARTWRNVAIVIHRTHPLRDRRIGVITNEALAPSVDEGLIPTLRQLGYEVAAREQIAQDPAAAQSQMPIAVSKLRAAGIDTMFIGIDPINGVSFVQEAEAQQWRPQWIVSDISAYTNDTSGNLQPASFDGAWAVSQWRIGFWRTGEAEAEFDASCMEILRRRIGQRPDVRKDASQFNDYFNSARACALVSLFSRAASAAGAELTATRWAAAMQQIGPTPLGFAADGVLSPAQPFAGGSQVRFARWHRSCGSQGCWKPEGPWTSPA